MAPTASRNTLTPIPIVRSSSSRRTSPPSLHGRRRTGERRGGRKGYARIPAPPAGYLRVQGSSEPDDLTSEVFLKVFQNLGSFRGTEEQFRSWVFTIAHHRLVDARRAQSRRPELADRGPAEDQTSPDGRIPSDDDVETTVMRHLSEERVRRLCDQLSPDQRDVLLLRLVADMTLQQTAEALGKTTGAVKALQHRSVAALQRLLEREGVSL